MLENPLKPDERWASVGADCYESYVGLLRLPDLTATLESDVVTRLERCRRLALHAYFDYEFVDIALEYGLFTVEMLLKRHMCSTADRLVDLVKEVEGRGWNELARKCNLLRKLRNSFAHPSHDSFGGVSILPGLRAVFIIANETAKLAPIDGQDA